ncbi:MAG: NADH-quinone oxidoreductase subunit 1, partial [Pseudomonadota bacterium]
MTFSIHPEQLKQNLIQVLGAQVSEVSVALNEVTVKVLSTHYLSVMQTLR